MSDVRHAVIYAAKSSEDRHGSNETQLADCRRAAKADGQKVEGAYSDEKKSGYSANRGPDLTRAQEHAERIGADLWVQHSDRLARGDGKTAQHLVQLVLWSREAGVQLRSVQDPQTFDTTGLVYAALMGDRNHEDSKRKSAAVTAGLKRRKERGKPVGAIPLGYTVEKKVGHDDELITRRVIDPATVGTIERVFDGVEAGMSFGDVARALNADGVKGRRGAPWVSRTVRTIVHNAAYAGRKGYPKIIEPDRFDAIHANLSRVDPVQLAKRQGGRKADDSYILRGIARCKQCGAAMYTRTQRGQRVYVCANRRQGTGLCQAPVISADLLEDHVLRHLDCFVGSVEDWISERLAERDGQRQARETAADHARANLKALDARREMHLREYRRRPLRADAGGNGAGDADPGLPGDRGGRVLEGNRRVQDRPRRSPEPKGRQQRRGLRGVDPQRARNGPASKPRGEAGGRRRAGLFAPDRGAGSHPTRRPGRARDHVARLPTPDALGSRDTGT